MTLFQAALSLHSVCYMLLRRIRMGQLGAVASVSPVAAINKTVFVCACICPLYFIFLWARSHACYVIKGACTDENTVVTRT